jgi:hypothetical protein
MSEYSYIYDDMYLYCVNKERRTPKHVTAAVLRTIFPKPNKESTLPLLVTHLPPVNPTTHADVHASGMTRDAFCNAHTKPAGAAFTSC